MAQRGTNEGKAQAAERELAHLQGAAAARARALTRIAEHARGVGAGMGGTRHAAATARARYRQSRVAQRLVERTGVHRAGAVAIMAAGQAERAAAAALVAAGRALTVVAQAVELHAAWNTGVAAYTNAEGLLKQETDALVAGVRSDPRSAEWAEQARHMPLLCLLWFVASQLPLARQTLPLYWGALPASCTAVGEGPPLLCRLVAGSRCGCGWARGPGRTRSEALSTAQLAEALSTALGSGMMAVLAQQVKQADQAGSELQLHVQKEGRSSLQAWSVQAQAVARGAGGEISAGEDPSAYASRRELALASLEQQLPGELVPDNLGSVGMLMSLGEKVLCKALMASGAGPGDRPRSGKPVVSAGTNAAILAARVAAPGSGIGAAVVYAIVWLGLAATAVDDQQQEHASNKRIKH